MSDRAHPCNARRGGSAGDPGRGSAAESHRADRDPAAEASAVLGQFATIASAGSASVLSTTAAGSKPEFG